jgi:hypothetical protein
MERIILFKRKKGKKRKKKIILEFKLEIKKVYMGF